MSRGGGVVKVKCDQVKEMVSLSKRVVLCVQLFLQFREVSGFRYFV